MHYQDKVLPILRDTRSLLLSKWGRAKIIGQKDVSPTNVVTKLDIEVEKNVSRKLAKIYPDIEFVGEEGGGDRDAKKFWLMDPIDGTGHFVRGTPFCTSMLALIENGEVKFSAIYDFINDKMYWASLGGGAFCNKKRIHVSSRTLKQSYLTWETHLSVRANLKKFQKLVGKAKLFNSISAGWEYVQIAEGKLDGRICFDGFGKDYDFAPGALLVSEAGGKVANIGRKTYDYRNTDFIAANPEVFKELTSGKDALFPINNSSVK